MCEAWGLGLRVEGSACIVLQVTANWYLSNLAWCSWSRVQGWGLGVGGSGCRVWSLGFGVWGLGFGFRAEDF